MSGTQPISAVVTTLSIVEAMAEYGAPIGVSELAKLVNTAKPRTYRHLRTLLGKRYVTQDADTDKYFLTLKFLHLGQTVATNMSFMNEAQREMPKLRDKANLSVSIGQAEEHGVRILDILRHRSTIEITTPPGTLLDFHSSAQGKIVLAFGSSVLLNQQFGKTLEQRTDHTLVEKQALRAEVEQVRKRGWAVAPEEAMIGINALAAPIFDASGDLAGTITIVGSIQHLPAEPTAYIVAAVRDAAAGISTRLGYSEKSTS